MRKKLPVGIESFKEFTAQDFYYVDKTGLIAELLHNWGKVNLFTRPRRFGKSLNMNMLKTFFEIGCEKKQFEGLSILKEQTLCEQYMGKFPVIAVTLKGIEGRDYAAAKNQLQMVIGTEAERFGFLAESNCLTENDKEKYQALTTLKNGSYQMTDAVLENSLHTLSQLLAKHFGKQVILLIDEYDVPLDKAFQGGYYDEMIALIRSLFGNVLKTNDCLQFAVLTGCLRISKESIFTGLNNLKTHSITDARYDEYFGFTDEEVGQMLDFYGLAEYADTFRNWYDGYRFGDVMVYCPWDVINYCDALLADPNARPKNYWANTSGNAMIRRFVGKAGRQEKKEIEQLIAGECIEKRINQELTYNELDRSMENLWSVLFMTGYLTHGGRADEEEGHETYRLLIPNREIRSLFVSQIQEWFNDLTREDPSRLEQFCRAFPDGNADLAEARMNEYLWNSISIRDTAVRTERKENFFHGMLLGLLQYENNWEISSNAEAGDGYCDISVMTPERVGVVIELKYAHDGDLAGACKRALAQIEQKHYDAELKKEGMETVRAYGIAFYKKNCKVIMSQKEER